MLAAIFVSGCQGSSKDQVLASSESQTQLRQIQSRVFDTTDKTKMQRTIIQTLQDLGFVVDKADQELGTISATKLSGYQLRITVTVFPRGQTQLIVRANAQYQIQEVTDPAIYQQFFTALEKSIFLTAQQVD